MIVTRLLNAYMEKESIRFTSGICSSIFAAHIGLEKLEFKNASIVNSGILTFQIFGGYLIGILYPITFPIIGTYSMYKFNKK
jgi:hypothetical protein